MSAKSDLYLDFVIEGIVTIVISGFGIVGNIFVIVTLSRLQMRSSINLLFLSLACFDLVFLVCLLLLIGIPSLSLKLVSLREYDLKIVLRIARVLEPTAYIAQTASTWTTVSVTVERYVAVCHPLKARYLCSYRKTRIGIIAVLIFSVCFNIPEFLRTIKIKNRQYGANNTVNETNITLGENEIFSKVYDVWMYLMVIYVIPFIVFVVLNALILRSIRIARKRRKYLLHRMEKEMQLVMMLIWVIVINFLCNVSRIVYILMDYYTSCCVIVEDISTSFLLLNSSVNVIIYYVFCAKFREMFLKLFCRCYHPDKEEDSLENMPECQRLNTFSTEK